MIDKLKENTVLYRRTMMLVILDLFFVLISSVLALYIRQETNIDPYTLQQYRQVVIVDILISFTCFVYFKLYRSLWLFASITELSNIFYSIIIATLIKIPFFVFLFKVHLPISWYILEPFILLILVGGSRIGYRYLRGMRNNISFTSHNEKVHKSNVMIIGAGRSGNTLLREIKNNHRLNRQVQCFIDDDPKKKNMYMNGIRVVGNRDDIIDSVNQYDIDEIYISIPGATAQERKALVSICKNTGCKVKVLFGLSQMIEGEVSVSRYRDVDIEDLLGREPVKVDMNEIASYVHNRVVMVTGGGGSIGSELCRQIAAQEPKQLVIVDIYENNAYSIQMELIRKYPDLNLEVRIASIRDYQKMDLLFNEFRPEVIYHAAAHKHVPLMEDSPNEAIKNNVFGTYNIVKLADKYKVKRFVQISTDKAVNPTNIMGASKRLCEMIIQSFDKQSETIYTAVRFGNVLGSNGSVIPLFKKQIANGGPVTVTDPNIIRYFMTIPEAVSLVMQAGIFAKGGEIYVLDMGEPVKIDEMARNLIQLSGYIPDIDIPIVYTGLRPGEKLYEELLVEEEGITKTSNNRIFIGHPIDFDTEEFFTQLHKLKEKSMNEDEHIKEIVSTIVTTYKPDLSHG